MSLFFKLLRWDFIREMRRKESLLNMILFAILTLFLIQMGAGPLFARLRGIPGDDFFITMTSKLGAVYFWVTVLFSGTVVNRVLECRDKYVPSQKTKQLGAIR